MYVYLCIILKLTHVHARTHTHTHTHTQSFSFVTAHMLSCLSHVQLFATPWIVAHQAPLSIGFPGKNIGVGCHVLLQRIFPTQESNPPLTCFMLWQVGNLPVVHWEAFMTIHISNSPNWLIFLNILVSIFMRYVWILRVICSWIFTQDLLLL